MYTKPEIVALILDLAGYDPLRVRLAEHRLLEPSCGNGAFMVEVIERLIASERRATSGATDWSSPGLDRAIMALDISEQAVDHTRRLIAEVLVRHDCPNARARDLANAWTLQTDFLLHDWRHEEFDFIIGNPPYVRLEDIPDRVLREYRSAYRTATDRADLYIPFFERGLTLLGSRGTLAFICANRFAKNQYGAALRKMIAGNYHVRHFINLEHTQPFLTEVSAYPAIIVLDRERGRPTHAASVDDLGAASLATLRMPPSEIPASRHFTSWYPDGAPWVSTCSHEKAGLEELERFFPRIEESAPGTRVGIGVATGADEIFVLPRRHPDIEPDCQLPLLMAQDISCDTLSWSGHWLLNPFLDGGQGALVNLDAHPGLGSYFKRNEERLRGRHCAKNRQKSWYRTIDRIWPELTRTPKLVLPDIQPGGVVGLDEGRFYPHHNVYWITSRTWDLRVLQAILRSSFVTDQIRAHSVAMRGGSIRYQAQNLRKVRIPSWDSLLALGPNVLTDLATEPDLPALDRVVERLLQNVRESRPRGAS